MSRNVKQKTQRTNSIHTGGARFPARTVYLPWGQTVLADGILGSNGIPTSIPIRRIVHEQGQFERRRAKEMITFIKEHPISMCYACVLPVFGAILQWGIPWLM